MALDSLSDLQFYCNGLWYQRWIIPAIAESGSSARYHGVNEFCDGLQIFGGIATIIKLALNIKSLQSNLTLQTSLTESGERVEKRRLVKAGFNVADIGLTIAAGISYFILAASWASPMFLAVSSLNLIRAIYCSSKNYLKFQSYLNNNSYSSTNPELHAAIVKWHSSKLRVSAFDLAIGVALLGCTVLWVMCPVPAAIALLAVAVISYFSRKQLKHEVQTSKQQMISLFSEQQKLIKPGFEPPSDNDTLCLAQL